MGEDDLSPPEDFDSQIGVDPAEPHQSVRDRQRKNIWLSNKLVADLEDIVNEDDSNLSTVIRQALHEYVRRRKEGNR